MSRRYFIIITSLLFIAACAKKDKKEPQTGGNPALTNKAPVQPVVTKPGGKLKLQKESKAYDSAARAPESAKKLKSFSSTGRRASRIRGKGFGIPHRPAPRPALPGDPIGKDRFSKKFNTEDYDRIYENDFDKVLQKPLSTFSIDVDTASYANMRRFLTSNRMPPKDSVRIEEFINYFSYNYPGPKAGSEAPFSVNAELASCPWTAKHKLLRIGLRGKTFEAKKRPNSNLVFLLDVSGSMNYGPKLPLLKKAFKLLVNKLGGKDRIAIVVYAGASGVVLESTPASEQKKILEALDKLRAGGSTNAGAGIEAAYAIAEKHFIKDGINRVILATDGDFNVGTTSRGDLVRLVEKKAKKNIFLTVLGFGMGNYKDSMLETLSGKGNGNYAYIDTINEARKVLVRQIGGTLITIAKDVKIQIEFNPAKVAAYRLIGYENRMLAAKDFNDDKKDAGEIGAGHMVTAIYELIPPGVKIPGPSVDALKYQTPKKLTGAAKSDEIVTVKLRFKKPKGTKSALVKFPLKDVSGSFNSASEDMRFASAVAAFAMLLRGSKYKGNLSYDAVINMAQKAMGADKYGYRKEFLSLVKKAQSLQK